MGEFVQVSCSVKHCKRLRSIMFCCRGLVSGNGRTLALIKFTTEHTIFTQTDVANEINVH